MNEVPEANILDTPKARECEEGISTPHDNDVLFGRGGNINIHPGNETFRKIVQAKKRVYLTARFKREKRIIADSILTAIQSLRPPGRFLARDSRTGLWHDVGYEKARDKTSQALRENAPQIRKAIEDENEALRAELEISKELEAKRAAEKSYTSHHGQRPLYNDFYSENMLPSCRDYRQEHVNNTDHYTTKDSRFYPPEVKSSSHYYHPTTYDHNSFQDDDNDMDYNRPRSHPYETDYQFQLPSDKDYSMRRAKEYREASDSYRPTSAPNLDLNCSRGAFNGLVETAGDIWDAAANIRPECITSHPLYEKKEDSIPIFSGDENKNKKTKQGESCENEIRTPAPSSKSSSVFGCNAAESMMSSLRHLTSKGSDNLQDMEIEEFSVRREESNGSIGGQSLVNVFDGDSLRNRETSEMSMLSFGDSKMGSLSFGDSKIGLSFDKSTR